MPTKSKRIPKKINPDIIVKTVLQIRFNLAIPGNQLLGKLYPILLDRFPQLEQKNQNVFPELQRIDRQLKYISNYSLSNSEFSVAFGNNSLSFEYILGYKGWDDFFSNVSIVLKRLDPLQNIFAKTERIGLRYINLIPEEKRIENVIDHQLRFDFEGNFSERNAFLRKEFELEDTRVLLTIAENTTFQSNQAPRKGILIDVDASKSKELPVVGSELLPIISSLHTNEKFIFFNALKQEYIESLNPSY